jgi:hypothetical protein
VSDFRVSFVYKFRHTPAFLIRLSPLTQSVIRSIGYLSAVWGVGLRPFACWDCGFEFRWGHGCLSLVSVMCWHIEVFLKGWSLVQRIPTECGVSECDCEASILRRRWPTRGCCTIGKIIVYVIYRTQDFSKASSGSVTKQNQHLQNLLC